MPNVNLDAQFVRDAVCQEGRGKTDYYDNAITGFILEVRSSGGATYHLRYRDSHGKQRQHKIGGVDDVTCAAARKKAQELRSEVVMGGDPGAKKALAKAGMTKDDIDVWEINEAFAVVAEKFQRDLDLDRSKVNINGGSIALGHPIGATGSMLIGTALDELERSGGRYALITMCAAGGMAPAIIVERL